MNKTIIFLDFDGVLNTEQYHAELALVGKSDKDHWGPLFDPRSIHNLRTIVEETGASIIVISTWRYIHGFQGLKDMWIERFLPGKLMGILPCDSMMPTRGEEIADYLKGHKDWSYAILDDIDEYNSAQSLRFVRINPVVGISESDARKAIEILNVGENNKSS